MTMNDTPIPDPDEDDDFEPAIIRPPNKIKDKVTLGGKIEGDGFDPELLKAAEERAEGLHDEFVELADRDIDKLHLACERAENTPEKRGELLKTVQRGAHEIKGYGSNIGYDLLTLVADSLSKFLLRGDISTEEQMKMARVHVDTIRLIFRQQMTGDGGEDGQKLLTSLNEAVAKY